MLLVPLLVIFSCSHPNNRLGRPVRRHCSGNKAEACDSLFCTCTCAISTSVPVSNVSVMLAPPSLVDDDEI